MSLDESLLLFRGRLSFRQYIKNKKARYGIKFFELTTSDGYVLNFEVYQGKSDTDSSSGKIDSIVKRLMEPYLDHGHHLYMDNLYNSVSLSEEMLKRKTNTTGTLRANRKRNPNEVIKKKLTKKDEFIWRRSGDIYVGKWKDKREVLFITTAHHPELIEVQNRFGKVKLKPRAIADYNGNMSGIDRVDQMIHYYSTPRKTIRWYKKVIFHIFDLCVWNSFFIYKKFHPRETFLQYRDAIIENLLQVPANITDGKNLVIKNRGGRPKVLSSTNEPGPSNENHFHHFPEKIPAPEDYKRKTYFLRCKQCSKNNIRKETSYRCKECQDKPALCPTCFEDFHLSIFQNSA